MSDIDEAVLKSAIRKLMEESGTSSQAGGASPAFQSDPVRVLRDKFSAFMAEPNVFQQGDVVKWKKGLKNKKYPKDDQLCMVVDVLEKPIVQDNRDSGSAYYREPLDLVLALLDDDSDLVIFHYDKRRFEIVSQ